MVSVIQCSHPIAVFPRDVAEQVVEHTDDVRESIEFGLRPAPAGRGGHWVNLGVLVREKNLLHHLFLDPVAVHVDGVENALGQIFLGR